MNDIEVLRALCDLTFKLTEISAKYCNHLVIENVAPELLNRLIVAYQNTLPQIQETAWACEITE